LSLILAADLHMTALARDVDRWRLFPWLREQAERLNVKGVGLLGDLTDQKDRHSETLVNKLVQHIAELAEQTDVYILRGNHDFVDEQHPYFRFLSNLERVYFVNEACLIKGIGAFIPCTRDETKFAEMIAPYKSEQLILTHQTYDGCVSENGTKLTGIKPSVFKDFKAKIWSGDVHVPQKVGKNIEYVGAPYRIKFGDKFEPRCVHVISSDKSTDLHFPGVRRELVEIRVLDDLPKLPVGTQVKIRVRLKRSEYPDWKNMRENIKRIAEKRKWDVHAIELEAVQERSVAAETAEMAGQSAEDVVRDYGARKKLSNDLIKTGLSLLKEASK